MPSPIPLAGGTLDRQAHRRTDTAFVEGLRADERALAVVIGRAAVEPLAGREVLAFLGVQPDGAPVFLVDERTERSERVDLRAAAATADGERQALLGYAAHLAHFHRTHRFCGQCGERTEPLDAGHARRCPNGHQHHVRTDPVVIMLVVDGGERCLLGRQPAWPPRRYSALAGFVEPGEDLETAVAREVEEEAGIEVGAVRYVASQPWPFPASLMLGFEVDWVAGEPQPDPTELEDARWCSRDEVLEAARHEDQWVEQPEDEQRALLLPPKLAIARHLIEAWLARTA